MPLRLSNCIVGRAHYPKDVVRCPSNNSPQKAMWNLKMDTWKRRFLFGFLSVSGNHAQKMGRSFLSNLCPNWYLGSSNMQKSRSRSKLSALNRCRSPVLSYCSEQDRFVDMVNTLRKDWKIMNDWWIPTEADIVSEKYDITYGIPYTQMMLCAPSSSIIMHSGAIWLILWWKHNSFKGFMGRQAHFPWDLHHLLLHSCNPRLALVL